MNHCNQAFYNNKTIYQRQVLVSRPCCKDAVRCPRLLSHEPPLRSGTLSRRSLLPTQSRPWRRKLACTYFSFWSGGNGASANGGMVLMFGVPAPLPQLWGLAPPLALASPVEGAQWLLIKCHQHQFPLHTSDHRRPPLSGPLPSLLVCDTNIRCGTEPEHLISKTRR